MSIEGIKVVSVPVSDQQVAKRYYCDVLGFEVVLDTEFTPEVRWIQLVPPGASTSITLVTWFPTAPPVS